jgi:hypothetical protein
MKKTTAVLTILVNLACSHNVFADEIIEQAGHPMVDERRQQWINEHYGRTGVLVVNGALVTSPCTLQNNEIELPSLPTWFSKGDQRYPMVLNLSGCGDGSDFSSPMAATIASKMVASSQFLSVFGADIGVGAKQIQLTGGDNAVTFYLSAYQYELSNKKRLDSRSIYSKSSTLELKLAYQ